MVDVLTPEQRSFCMSRIRGKDTKPEIFVRKLVYAMGFRYRLHDKRLPGRPDLVFPGRRKVIFVHGCYWHRHNCRFGKTHVKSNVDFWDKKLSANVKRDQKNRRSLKQLGWDVLVIWECQTRTGRQEWIVDKINKFLGHFK